MTEITLTILLSAVKFAMTFPLAIMKFHFGFAETVLWTNVGGTIGIYFFAYLSRKLILWWKRTFRKYRRKRVEEKHQGKKVFTRRNRRIILIKQKYGLFGIAATTPFLLSIPLGVFLVVRYYRSVKSRFIFLIVSNLVWSVIYSAFYIFWDGVLFKRG